jgi:hypothetical protein
LKTDRNKLKKQNQLELKLKGNKLINVNMNQKSIFRITESRPDGVSIEKNTNQLPQSTETALLSALDSGRLDECGRV